MQRRRSLKPYLFNGKELDTETGLYYYGARYYDPRVSLWLNVDPMMLRDEAMDDEDSSNGGVFNPINNAVYTFSYQNPVKYVDPDGECPLCVVVLLAGFSVLDAPTQNVTANQIAKQEATDLRNRMLLSTATGGTGGAIAQGVSEMETIEFGKPTRIIVKNGINNTKSKSTENSKPITNPNGNGGKMKNKLAPDKNAGGDHTSFQRDKDGNIYKYETYKKTKTGHFDKVKRFDGGKPDGSQGAPHNGINTPHVQEKKGVTRKPTPEEYPNNKRFNK